jgi:DNA repair exonuclease SbcCD nuclease subunit
VKIAAASPAASKDELRARIEKLERANATLRTKNKDLRLAHVEVSEQVEALTLKLESLERRAERQARQEMAKGNGAAKPRAAAASMRRGRSASAPAESHDEDEVAETAEA